METQQFKELSGKLDRIATLLALTVVRGLRPEEQVSLLSSAGFQPSEIARLIDKTPNAVRIILFQLRKKSKQASPASSALKGRASSGEKEPAE